MGGPSKRPCPVSTYGRAGAIVARFIQRVLYSGSPNKSVRGLVDLPGVLRVDQIGRLNPLREKA
jgi:hypothetical protein